MGSEATCRELVGPSVQPQWVGTAAEAEAALITLKRLHQQRMLFVGSSAGASTSTTGLGTTGCCGGGAEGGLAVGCDTEWASNSTPAVVQLAVQGEASDGACAHCWLIDTQLAAAAVAAVVPKNDLSTAEGVAPIANTQAEAVMASKHERLQFAATVQALLAWLFQTSGVRLLGFAFKADLAKLAALTGRDHRAPRAPTRGRYAGTQTCNR